MLEKELAPDATKTEPLSDRAESTRNTSASGKAYLRKDKKKSAVKKQLEEE